MHYGVVATYSLLIFKATDPLQSWSPTGTCGHQWVVSNKRPLPDQDYSSLSNVLPKDNWRVATTAGGRVVAGARLERAGPAVAVAPKARLPLVGGAARRTTQWC